jgi:plasmid stability protein
MNRLQIRIDEELNSALERRAQAEGRTKASLVRDILRAAMRPLAPLSDDPLSRMVGADAFDPGDVDEVTYP